MPKSLAVRAALRRAAIAFAAASFLAAAACAAALLLAAVDPCRAAEEARAPLGYQILEAAGGSFTVYYPSDRAKLARETARLLEESAGAIAGELGLETIDPVKVVIASDQKTFELLHRGAIPEWGIAFANVETRMLGVNADLVAREPREFSTVVRHELSHLLLAQRIEGVPMPTWFMEGLAIVQSGEWDFSDEWRFTTTAGRREIPYLEELRGAFPRSSDGAVLAYGMSYFAVRRLLDERPGSLITLTAFVRDEGDFEGGFESAFGRTAYDFSGRLYVEIDRRYRAPGAILNAAPYWALGALLFVAVFLIKRARSLRKLERWEREEREGRG